jgi:glutamate dehydrogenase/leucine dehydrogenase
VVTTVSDAVGAVHNPKGLDILALRRHIAEGNKLVEFSGGEAVVAGACVDCHTGAVLEPGYSTGVVDCVHTCAATSSWVLEEA